MDMERALQKAWPWTAAFLDRLLQLRREPFRGSHLLFGSDYSGDDPTSRLRVYAFVVADADVSTEWPSRCHDVRRRFLKEGRRMAFKNLNDGQRRRALVPFLEAAEYLHGHVVGVIVAKEFAHLSTLGAATLDQWKRLHGLQATWDAKSFEEMVRVAHFFSLFLTAWSAPGMHVSWVTDDDAIVANERRLEDAHQLAARLSGVYLPHALGEFMMNTVAVDAESRAFEDFVAVADLAAGMLREVVWAAPARSPGDSTLRRETALSAKADTIADWFWYSAGSLKKTCIVIERADPNRFGVGELRLET